MAAVTRVLARPVSPPGYEVNDKAQAAAALTAGDLVSITSATPARGFDKVVDLLPTADAPTDKKTYVVLMDCPAGGVANISDDCEMDGWSGMTPGNPLYPSGSAAGGIDTSAPTFYSAGTTPAVAVPARARMWALTATRIRFRL
jgi:hypothetical protein